MLTRAGTICVAAALGSLIAAASNAVADEDSKISVDPGWAGWIDTKVVDPGSLGAPKQKQRRAKAPSRTCTQTKSPNAGGYATQERFDSGAPASEGEGGWVIRRCSDGTLDTAWVPVAEPREVAATVEQLARRATNRLPLPLPQPEFEPRRQSSAGPTTLVTVPTWFFVEGWKAVTQRTQAGAAWAEVSAEPVATLWWPGDGSGPVRCAGSGRAWSKPAKKTAPCIYAYTRSSAAQPGNVYTARVVVTWRVTWRGAGGRSGTLPLMERQTTFPVAVAERQTVIVGGESP